MGRRLTGSYERGGSFRIDQTGALVDARGRALQGINFGNDGSLPFGSAGTVALGPGTAMIQPTRQIDFAGNLDPQAEIPAGPFDVDNPVATSSFSSSVLVSDSSGNQHALDPYFVRTGAGAWSWYVIAERQAGCDSTGRDLVSASGQLSFDSGGTLVVGAASGSSWSFVGALPDQPIVWNFGAGLRQDPGQFWANSMDHNNVLFHDLRTLKQIQPNGSVIVSLDGTEATIAFVTVVTFKDFAGLASDAPGIYRETDASGPAIAGIGGGDRGSVLSGFLESH